MLVFFFLLVDCKNFATVCEFTVRTLLLFLSSLWVHCTNFATVSEFTVQTLLQFASTLCKLCYCLEVHCTNFTTVCEFTVQTLLQFMSLLYKICTEKTSIIVKVTEVSNYIPPWHRRSWPTALERGRNPWGCAPRRVEWWRRPRGRRSDPQWGPQSQCCASWGPSSGTCVPLWNRRSGRGGGDFLEKIIRKIVRIIKLYNYKIIIKNKIPFPSIVWNEA